MKLDFASLTSLEPALLRRCPENPILTTEDIPYSCKRVYNPAATRLNGRYALVIRVDSHEGEQMLGLALSDDGIHFTVEPEPILRPDASECGHLNDPRITMIDGEYILTYCSDPQEDNLREEGIFLCIARSRDLRHWERIYRSLPDNRNAVVFPEKINGKFARLERPFRRAYRLENGYDIWFSDSPDLEYWGNHHLVLSYLDVAWGSHKIGPAAPPIKTGAGWLTFFHGAFVPEECTADGWKIWPPEGGKVYCAGLMLLDLQKPWLIRARCPFPVLTPRMEYEQDPRYRPNVVFPCGIIPEPDGSVKIYYGASDICIAMATAHIDQLVEYCLTHSSDSLKQ